MAPLKIKLSYLFCYRKMNNYLHASWCRNIISVLLIPVIAYVSYRQFESIAFLLIILLLYFITYIWLFNRGLKRRRLASKMRKNGFEILNEKPLLNEDEKSNWCKGVGFIDSVEQPTWIKVHPDGVVVYFLSIARSAPFLISWDEIKNIALQEKVVYGKKMVLAEIYIERLKEKIILPWSENFSNSVPSSIGVVVKYFRTD